jgi:hypothetical protein
MKDVDFLLLFNAYPNISMKEYIIIPTFSFLLM